MDRLVVGLGSGRCGTHSLADLLGGQPGTTALHQPDPCLPWHTDPGWYAHVRELVAATPGPVVALVAWYYLNYVELLLRDHPGARFVCLKRERSATVASVMRLTPEFDHWSSRPARESPTTQWRHLFPSYDVEDKATALGLYHDEYYGIAEDLERRHPGSVRVFPTEALNDPAGVDAILDFAGYGPDRLREVGLRSGDMEPYRWRSGGTGAEGR